MKNQILYFVIISCFFTSFVNAQSWGGDGARWWYDAYGYGYWGYIEMNVNGDTIIQGQLCKKLQKKTRIYSFVDHAIFEGYLKSDFFFEADSVIYLYLQYKNEFDTLYNFGAAVGEAWTTQRYPGSAIIKTTVLNKGEQNINGETLHWLLLEYKDEPGFPQIIQDTVFERIGNTKAYYYPWDYFEHQLDGGEGGGLRCYQDNKIGLFHRISDEYSCDFITATRDQIADNLIQISPNPFTNQLNVNFSKPFFTNFEIIIYSIEGQVIKRVKLSENSEAFEVPTAELPQGYYLLTLVEQGAVRYTTKVIKF